MLHYDFRGDFRGDFRDGFKGGLQHGFTPWRPHRRAGRGLLILVLIWAVVSPLGAEPAATSRIEIHKASRQLLVFSGDEQTATYSIGLGFEPTADKKREGDGATPEGRYVVCVKNPQSQYYLSLGLNYPNSRDAERALAAGQISAAEAAAIQRAERRGICPPWNTALGGEIFIHGRGSSSDWTLGCVALDDPAMKALYDSTPIGTEVVIRP